MIVFKLFMRTRSKSKIEENSIILQKIEYSTLIDFDEASLEWKKNKKRGKFGSHSYICGIELRSGRICKREENHDYSCSSVE